MRRYTRVTFGLSAWLLVACSSPSTDATREDLAASEAASSAVRVVVEPSDGGTALLAAIQAAKTSVHMTMYLLTESAVLDALVARHRAGVEVKVALNKIVFGASGPATPNQKAFDALHAAGVPVAWAPSRFLFTHEKTVVLDGTAAWIMTMNAATTSMTRNREYLAVDTTPADVTEAEAQFAADFADQPFTPSGDLVMAPDNARPRLLALVNSAQTTLDVEAEELSDKEVTTAMCSGAGRGVKTRVVISTRSASNAQKQAIADLKACGVPVVGLAHPYVHAKAVVVDGSRVYVGSANLSRDSLDRNRELGVITSAKEAVTPVAQTVAKDIAAGTFL